MAQLVAPMGVFLIVELDPAVRPEQVKLIFRMVARLPGVSAVADLATVPLELLAERVLLHLTPEEQRMWQAVVKGDPRGHQGGGHQPARRKPGAAKTTERLQKPERKTARARAPRGRVSDVPNGGDVCGQAAPVQGSLFTPASNAAHT